MTERIDVGDRVILKSGSPRMTVSERDDSFEDGHVLIRCVWFNDKREPQRDHFDERTLRKAIGEEDDKPSTTGISFPPNVRA